MPTIVFNGKSYNSIDEMPANEKQAYQSMMGMLVDKNGNGIPDLLEGDMVQKVMSVHQNNAMVNVNGKTYTTLNDLPPDIRQKVDGAFKMLFNLGITSNTETQSQGQNQFQNPPEALTSTSFVSREYNPVIEEERSSNFKTWLLFGVVIMACLGIAAVAVFAFLYL